MKHLFFCIFLINSVLATAQTSQFTDFLDRFHKIENPIDIDRYRYDDYFDLFFENYSIFEKEYGISKADANKYLYHNTMDPFELLSMNLHGIGLRWTYKDYHILMPIKWHDRGYSNGSAFYTWNLYEYLILVYDNKGNFVAKETIGKFNDWWEADIYIKSANEIIVTQYLLIDISNFTFPKDCYIQTIQYKILDSGVILKNTLDENIRKVVSDPDYLCLKVITEEEPDITPTNIGNVYVLSEGEWPCCVLSDGWLTHSLFGDDLTKTGLETFLQIKNIKEESEDVLNKIFQEPWTVRTYKYKKSMIKVCQDPRYKKDVVIYADIKDKDIVLSHQLRIGTAKDKFFDILFNGELPLDCSGEALNCLDDDTFYNLILGERHVRTDIVQSFNFQNDKLKDISIKTDLYRLLFEYK